MPGGIRLTSAVPAVAVDQDHLQRDPLASGVAQQLDGRERAAGTAPDDCDQWSAIALFSSPVHR